MMSDEVEVPEYELMAPFFCAPDLIPAGTVIKWSGPPGSFMEPRNEAATQAMEKHLTAKPHARITPVESLPISQVEIVAKPKPDTEPVLDLASAQLTQAVQFDAPKAKQDK